MSGDFRGGLVECVGNCVFIQLKIPLSYFSLVFLSRLNLMCLLMKNRKKIKLVCFM